MECESNISKVRETSLTIPLPKLYCNNLRIQTALSLNIKYIFPWRKNTMVHRHYFFVLIYAQYRSVLSYLKLYPKQRHTVGFHEAGDSWNFKVKVGKQIFHTNITSIKWKTFLWELGQDEIVSISIDSFSRISP